MSRLQRLFLLCLLLGVGCTANAQSSGVHTEYVKSDKETHVETNMMYVYDTPDQFVELKLRTWYKGEKLTKPPGQVFLEIFSLSKSPLYRNDPLFVVADGVSAKIGNLYNLIMRGRTENGVDRFFTVGGTLTIGMEVPVPKTAQIRAGGSVDGKTMEMLDISIKPDQLVKLAQATRLEFRLKNLSFTLDDRQMEIVRNFTKQITLP